MWILDGLGGDLLRWLFDGMLPNDQPAEERRVIGEYDGVFFTGFMYAGVDATEWMVAYEPGYFDPTFFDPSHFETRITR